MCCQCCSKESVAISGLCVVSAGLRRVLVYQACVLSVLLYGECWYIKPVCCQCCSKESVGISSLCVVSAALRRVLVYQACVLSVLL